MGVESSGVGLAASVSLVISVMGVESSGVGLAASVSLVISVMRS